jgi:serine/threonine-protein kinase
VIDVGSTLGPYEIVANLSSGGMATLFLARRAGAAGFARHVAIKVVHDHLARDSQFVRMFVDEAKLAARIQHPNVVHVEELGEHDGTYFLAMEYVHGCSLAELLSGLARRRRKLSPELAAWVAMQVAEGLHAAHETSDPSGQPLGVVHRDVSPQNVILADKGHVKLIDFGIAKARGRQQQSTVGGALKGKFRYMAPEQGLGRTVDRRTDVYALGIVLWEMLAMRRMFTGETDIELLNQVRDPRPVPPSTYAEDVPPALDQVVLQALHRDPAQRHQTALELRRHLATALPGAGSIDASQLAEVVQAMVGEKLEQRRQALPRSMSEMWQPLSTEKVDPRATAPTAAGSARHDAVVQQLTHHAPKAVRYAQTPTPPPDHPHQGPGSSTMPLETGLLERVPTAVPSMYDLEGDAARRPGAAPAPPSNRLSSGERRPVLLWLLGGAALVGAGALTMAVVSGSLGFGGDPARPSIVVVDGGTPSLDREPSASVRRPPDASLTKAQTAAAPRGNEAGTARQGEDATGVQDEGSDTEPRTAEHRRAERRRALELRRRRARARARRARERRNASAKSSSPSDPPSAEGSAPDETPAADERKAERKAEPGDTDATKPAGDESGSVVPDVPIFTDEDF